MPVLFSVLVIHWITAKDSVATLSDNYSAETNAPPSPTSKRIFPRPSLYEVPSSYKLSSYDTKKKSQLTTFVSASKVDLEEEEIDRIHTFPASAITVEHNLRRLVSGSLSERNTSEDQRNTGSEDDLFQKS